ncbi:MAG TPA: hypothetical protein VMY76_11775 [Gemmatimonadales bacterium]|nr:hypothetical protein [Gemmatimonadales bacterium]
MTDEDWHEQMKRLDQRTAQRREKNKAKNEEMEEMIRQAEERRDKSSEGE